MTTLITYATPWDMHDGTVSISKLPTEKQNELIYLSLSPDGDSRQFAIDHNLKKTQVDGLWSLIVWVGLELETNGVISSFDARDDGNINSIVEFFNGTKLGVRLKSAIQKAEDDSTPSFYDWTELSPKKTELLADFIGYSLAETKQHLLKHLATTGHSEYYAQPEIDLSPIQPSFREKIGDAFFYIFNRKQFNRRIIDRKILPFRIKYFERIELEIKATVNEKIWLLFLESQSSDINFLKATHLLYEAGFLSQTPPQNLVPHILRGVRIFLTESKSSGALAMLAASKEIKAESLK